MSNEALVKRLRAMADEEAQAWGEGDDVSAMLREAADAISAPEAEAVAVERAMADDAAKFAKAIGWDFCTFEPSSSPCECCGEPHRQLYFQGPDDAGRYYCLPCVVKEHEQNVTDAAVAYAAPAHSEQAAVPDDVLRALERMESPLTEYIPKATASADAHCMKVIGDYIRSGAAAPSAPAVIQQLTTAGDGWMPIETAPKDGTHAIVAKIGATDAIPQMGIEAKAAHVWWAVRGFWDDKHERWTDGLEHLVPPSHWIPMPAATESVPVRAVTPLSCPKCFARWLFWPSEQSGFGQDTLSLISPASCDYCEPAGSAELESLNRVKPTVTGIHLPAAPREPRT